MKIEPGDKKKKEHIEPIRFPGVDFKTIGSNYATNIHVDVWGYNAKKQTTVVIEKNGLTYHLFGSAETRFLSPDSTFSEGQTFQAVMNDLKRNKIDKLYEMIYGKKGFDYWIDYYTKKRTDKLLEISKNEKMLSDMRMSNITTSSKAKKKKGSDFMPLGPGVRYRWVKRGGKMIRLAFRGKKVIEVKKKVEKPTILVTNLFLKIYQLNILEFVFFYLN
jgi:hypothetical protein